MMGMVAALGACLAVGALIDRAVFRVPDACATERLGRALMWGLGTLGVLSMALDAAGMPVRAAALGGLASLVATLALRAALRPGAPAATVASSAPPAASPAPSSSRPASRPALVAEAGLLLLAAVSLGQALFAGFVRPTFQFDSLTRWMFKAKVLAFEQTLRGPVSVDPGFAFTHQRYPPLVSHVANLPALVTGGFDDRVAQSLFPWFAVALVLVVHGVLLRHAGRLKAALGAAWVASLPLLSYLPFPPPGSGAASAMADIPLALFATGAGLALVDGLGGRRDRAHVEAALLLGFATLTKNEGLPLVAGAALALLACAPSGRLRRALGVGLPPLLLYTLLWGRLVSGFPALDEDYAGHVGVQAVVGGLDRLPVVLRGIWDEVTHFRAWNLTWPLVLALLLAGRPRRATCAPLVLVLVQLLAYVAAFLITVWTSPGAETQGGDPVVYLMSITMGRLLMHVAPLLIATAILASPPLLPGPSAGVPVPAG
jgi:hypothetical protein